MLRSRMQAVRSPTHRSVVAAFARGAVVGHPAEAMYGLGVRADDVVAVERLRRLKGSPAGRGFIVLVADIAAIEGVGVWTPAGLAAARIWPAPLSIILPARPGLPAASPDGTVAVRVPSDPDLRDLLAAAGGPIVSTSANRAGEEPARTAAEVVRTFGGEIAVVVDGGPRAGLPSTVVDATGPAARLVRPGAVPWAAERVA